MLGPKAIGPSKSTDNDDGETATKPNTKRLSCGSCGRPISGSKPDGKKPPTDAEKPEDKPKQDETKSKPDEPQVDTEAIKSIVKQSQGLYTRLQPSSDPQDFSHYGEPDLNSMPGDNFTNVDMNGAQTVYANADVNSRQVAYDNFNIQSFQ
jgi:hypothetical protein